MKAFLVFRLIDLIMLTLYVLLWGLHIIRKLTKKSQQLTGKVNQPPPPYTP